MDTPPRAERAVIYVHAPGEVRRWAVLCLAHVERCGYVLVGFVDDHDGSAWHDIVTMATEHRVEVVVIGDRSQLPDFRQPRLEVAEDIPGPPQRRPHIIR